MILAAGLTPAWQQIVCLDKLQVGQVNRAQQVLWCASGKVLNVGLALKNLDAPVRVLSAVGGASGAAIRNEFRELAIDAAWIETGRSTRVCTTILDRAGRATTELVQNSGALSAGVIDRFQHSLQSEAAAAQVVVVSGSLPQGTPPEIIRDSLQNCAATVILDLRGPELLRALDCRPFLIKPNRQELGVTVGRNLKTTADVVRAMAELNERGAQWVMVTDGAEPVLTSNGATVFELLPTPSANVVNPIGCGDCAAAGVAWGIYQGTPPLDAFRFGLGAAAMNLGDLRPARIDEKGVRAAAALIEVRQL